jgi:Ribbon-helix-helix protein, copG family
MVYIYIMRRTQIYLTDIEAEALKRESKKTGLTRSQLVREAIGAKYLGQRSGNDLEVLLVETAGTWKGRSRSEGHEYVERVRRGRRLSAALARREQM